MLNHFLTRILPAIGRWFKKWRGNYCLKLQCPTSPQLNSPLTWRCTWQYLTRAPSGRKVSLASVENFQTILCMTVFFAQNPRWRKINTRRKLAVISAQTQVSKLTPGNTRSSSPATAKKGATCCSEILANKQLSLSVPTFERLAGVFTLW